MKLSIVTTLYRSANHIEEFYSRASAVAQEYAGNDYEIIMVNDGSPDNSLDLAIQLAEKDNHLKVIELSRNFGQHKAMITGLRHACGEEIFILDDDLEEAPEWLLPFAEEMHKHDVDVVFGVQESRKGGWFERISGRAFYWLYNKLCGTVMHANPANARIMKKKYVEAVLSYTEREFFLGGIMASAGFKQRHMTVKKLSISPSNYSLYKKFIQFTNAVLSFSNAPLYFIFIVGIAISILSVFYVLYTLIIYLIYGSVVSGWASTIVSLYFLGGVIIACLGVVGLYISKIFVEVKQRPYTIIRRTINIKERSHHEVE